ncbi:MAG: type II toxin-antitoxin system HipA family toxin [Bacteriovoracaceae bacterium]|nr:type II toxin-antitoxin system HipA family toxin [Bacteriovoracaceae bacterium]
MKKITVADVILWGKRIGAISWNEDRNLGTFEYDANFLSAKNIEPSPFKMKKKTGSFSFAGENKETFKGLPGMLADSLPDKFGNALIDSWLTKNGRKSGDFSPVERLCYIGKRAMGALEFSPATSGENTDESIDISLDEIVKLASKVLSDREKVTEKIDTADDKQTEQALKNLLLIGSSAGGARAKCLIAYNKSTGEIKSGQVKCPDGFDYYLLKLDGVAKNKDKELNDPQGYGRSEFAYYKMALDCKINMTECELIEENGRAHFMTKRFDRIDGQKIHMQSLCGLKHYDFNQAGAHSYEQALEVIRELVKNGQKKALEQQFRRAAFNVISRNQDDHTKNIAFLMNKQGDWSLSPAYDVAYSYNPSGPWTNKHQMQLNGKRENFTLDDLIQFGKKADLSEQKVKTIMIEITKVVRNWKDYFNDCSVPKEIIDGVEGNLRLNLIDIEAEEKKK